MQIQMQMVYHWDLSKFTESSIFPISS